MQCVYLGPERPGKKVDDRQIYECAVHGDCTTVGPNKTVPSCEHCKSRLTLDSPKLATDFKDPLVITDRDGTKFDALRGMLRGLPTFLVAGGPSARKLPLHLLNQRGVWSMAVNNMAGYCRPSSFVCSDPPLKFHHGIWLDPTVMKFIPTAKFSGGRKKLKMKVGEEFKPLHIGGKDITTKDVPNIWGFGRRSWILPDDTFFTDPHATHGNNDAGVRRTGGPKTLMTMLCAIRLLYYLGSRTIYLVGVDFNMDPMRDVYDNYAFQQARDPGTCESNNSQFFFANQWLCTMKKKDVFKKFGLEIFNCNVESGLRAFEHAPFDAAIADTLKDFPKEPFDLEGWYEKK